MFETTPSHSRPLPPVESRESVISIASQIVWEPLDGEYDLFQCKIGSKRPHACFQGQSDPSTVSKEMLHGGHGVEGTLGPLPKKKRLVLSQNAAEVANDILVHTPESQFSDSSLSRSIYTAPTSPLSQRYSSPRYLSGPFIDDLEHKDSDGMLVDTSSRLDVPSADAHSALENSSTLSRHIQQRSTAISCEAERRSERSIPANIYDGNTIRNGLLPNIYPRPQNSATHTLRLIPTQNMLHTSTMSKPFVQDETDRDLKWSSSIHHEYDKGDKVPFSYALDSPDADMFEDEIEGLLDIAQSGPDGTLHRHKTHSAVALASNPASRAATEQWLTQNNHLVNRSSNSNGTYRRDPPEEGETRLRALTKIHHKIQPPGRTQFLRSSDVSKISSTGSPTKQSVSGLDMLVAKRHTSGGQVHSLVQLTKDPLDAQQPVAEYQIEDLSLPKSFDRLSKERQELVVQHEKLKERIRDVQTIKDTYLAIAKLKCLGDLRDSEQQEIQQANKFMVLVLEQRGSGKTKRKAVTAIRDNMRRRASKHAPPEEAQIEDGYEKLLGRLRIAALEQELEVLREQEFEARSGRLTASSKSHDASKHEKQRQRKITRPIQTGATATENRRQAQYAVEERKRSRIEAQLHLFNAEEAKKTYEIETNHQDPTTDNTESSSDVSEDETGHEFVFGAGTNSEPQPKPTLATVSLPPLRPQSGITYENELFHNLTQDEQRQDEEDPAIFVSDDAQAAEPNVLSPSEQGLLIEQYRRLHSRQATGPPPPVAEQIVDCEDSSDETGSIASSLDLWTSEDRDVTVYTVYGQFSGLHEFFDGEKYELTTTQNMRKANHRMEQEVKRLQKSCDKSPLYEPGCSEHNIKRQNGLDEHRVSFGENQTVSAVIWTETSTERLSKRNYRKAESRDIVRAKSIWVVKWKRTISVVEYLQSHGDGITNDTVDSQGVTKHDYKTLHASTTMPDDDDLQRFENSYTANLHAKCNFLEWYAIFHQGPLMEREIFEAKEDMDRYMEQLGTIGLFDRELEFVRSIGPMSLPDPDPDPDEEDEDCEITKASTENSSGGSSDNNTSRYDTRLLPSPAQGQTPSPSASLTETINPPSVLHTAEESVISTTQHVSGEQQPNQPDPTAPTKPADQGSVQSKSNSKSEIRTLEKYRVWVQQQCVWGQ